MKLRHRIAAAAVATPLALAIGGVNLATSASAYSTPTRVYYGQACTPGHGEGITANRTRITLTGGTALACYYRIDKYTFWQKVSTDYLTLNKIVKRCPGAPIQMSC